MALALADLFRRAQPAELLAVREALDAAKDPAPGRDVMPDDERRALGADLVRRAEAAEAACTKRAADRAELERRIAAAQATLDTLHAPSPVEDDFAAWWPSAAARLWAGRLALVDELTARCHKEAADLWPPASVTLEPRPTVRSEGRMTFSQEPAIRERAAGLRALADLVASWTRRGGYSTQAGLQALFTKAYEDLPRVPPLLEILERHPRGRAYLAANGFNPPSLPPAA